MPAPRHTPEQKARALELYRDHGPAEASRQTGVPRVTVSQWARRSGVTVTAEATARATETAEAWRERRLAEITADLVEIAHARSRRLRQKIETNSEREMVQVIDIALSKVQLLTGKATERTETLEPVQAKAEIERLQAEWRKRHVAA